MRNAMKKVCLMLAVAACGIMLQAGPGRAAESQKLFDVDVNKQKAGLEKDFVQAEVFLGQTKLQNARSQVELLAHKLKLMKNDISKEEAASYQTRIDNVVTKIGAKEDSLIKVTMDILHTKGVDPALAYLQNDLRMFGVTEKKTGPAEKTILEEAPKIQQTLERQGIERAVKALQSGQPLDPDMDPYIVKTAERIIKAHADSVTAVENAKARKELEEKQRVERIQREKEEKEKKLEEEKAAKIKQEEDKKKLAEQEIARKKADAEEKEKQRLARIEEERQQKLAVQAEKARKDSVAAAQKLAEQQAQQEKERQSKLSVQQKEQERLARIEQERQQKQADKARKDSLAAAQKLAEKQAKQERGKSWKDSLAAARQDSIAQQQALLAEVKKIVKEQQPQQEKEGQGKLGGQQNEQEHLARAGEERRMQELAQQDKARKDSIAAAQKAQQQQAPSAAAKKAEKEAQQQEIQAKEQQRKLEAEQKEQERLARAEEERRRQDLAQQDKARKDSIAAAQKRSAMQAQQEKEQQKKLEAQQKEQERLARAEEERKKQEREMRKRYEADSIADAQTKLAISKSAQKYLQGLRDNQKKAQDMVMALYDLIDKKRIREALDRFKQDRAFIAQFVDAQVFNVLEQTIAQSAISAQPEAAVAAPAKPAARVPEQESIDKINSFMQNNNVVGAYGEFKKTESTLRHYMTREEFKQLKNMVENAYKLRKQGAK